jgi:hypothetical protein
MKKILILAALFFSVQSIALAQDKTNTATAASSKELAVSKTSGSYSFVLPEGTKKEDVERNAKFYSKSFTVTFDEASKKANIQMVVNDEKNRHVVVRFLTASKIQFVNVDGKNLNIDDFYKNYML